METISLKMEKDFLNKMEAAMKQANYATKTEFIREAIREKMQKQREEQIDRELRKHFGILKTQTSDEKRERIGEEVARKIMKKHGLE